MQTIRRVLDNGWRVRESERIDVPAHLQLPWLPAQVPGHIHLDLIRGGVIPDPFQRLHERDVAWVDEADWVYETTFRIDEPLNGDASLVFRGLDTIAEIELNGEPIGQSDNMFVPHEFSVNGCLRLGPGEAGENTLRITFRSAKRVGMERLREWNTGPDPVPEHWDSWGPRSLVRKAQYMFGWDWGPVLISCGIWQPVELVTTPVARLGEWRYTSELAGDGKTVVVQVCADVELSSQHASAPLWLRVDLDGQTAVTQVPNARDVKMACVSITIDHPELWQPNGVGAATLYPLSLALLGEQDSVLDSRAANIGFKTVELIREPDSDGSGEGFKFRINGRDVFIKGANWIPNYSFPGAITDESLRERITQARDAGFNMLRVWGGGLYETESFYKLCDELGLLVWQDFTYGCAYYPDTGKYAESARIEATAAVRRIRNHASLALWCGNNENSTMFHSNWGGAAPERYLGEHLYNEILPAVVAAENPEVPYWPSSPFGGDNPNSADYGDCHNWDVWHGRGDWVHYTENDSRFCSEFGFAASCGLPAWNTVLADEDRDPHAPAVRWHDKTRKGYETYLNYIRLHYPEPRTLEDLVYYSQINQAEALKYGVEHYRRLMGRCWGTLYWQLNDCWPVQSWAVIDFLGEPKAAYYASKRFYAPLLLSLIRRGNAVTAHLVSDLAEPQSGELTLSVQSFEGETLTSSISHVTVGQNQAAPVAEINISPAVGREQEAYVFAEFKPQGGKAAATNLLFVAEPKDLHLPAPGISSDIHDVGQNRCVISVTARKFAPYVWLRSSDDSPLRLDDNFFHLRAGETRQIVANLETHGSISQLQEKLIVRTLQIRCADIHPVGNNKHAALERP